jgi:hypothetical protein
MYRRLWWFHEGLRKENERRKVMRRGAEATVFGRNIGLVDATRIFSTGTHLSNVIGVFTVGVPKGVPGVVPEFVPRPRKRGVSLVPL